MVKTYTVRCENVNLNKSWDVKVKGLANARAIARKHRDEHRYHAADVLNAKGKIVGQFMQK